MVRANACHELAAIYTVCVPTSCLRTPRGGGETEALMGESVPTVTGRAVGPCRQRGLGCSHLSDL